MPRAKLIRGAASAGRSAACYWLGGKCGRSAGAGVEVMCRADNYLVVHAQPRRRSRNTDGVRSLKLGRREKMAPSASRAVGVVVGVMQPRAIRFDVRPGVGAESDLRDGGRTENDLCGGRGYCRNHSESD